MVLTACLGAGTGGGATPEIVKALHDMGIATVCFVTRPFTFEGEARRKAAERVLPMIEENADSLVVVALDDLVNDGSHPEREPEALLAARGDVGEIVNIGHATEVNEPVYLVDFDGCVVGCLEIELAPVPAGWFADVEGNAE